MEPLYRHTQVAWARLAVVGAVVACYLAFILPMPNGRAYLLVLLALAAVVLAHAVLTVEVTRDEVIARFGGGWRARRVTLSRVRAARVVANPRYHGFGVRITPKGMLYNVAGRARWRWSWRAASPFAWGPTSRSGCATPSSTPSAGSGRRARQKRSGGEA